MFVQPQRTSIKWLNDRFVAVEFKSKELFSLVAGTKSSDVEARHGAGILRASEVGPEALKWGECGERSFAIVLRISAVLHPVRKDAFAAIQIWSYKILAVFKGAHIGRTVLS